MSATPAAGSRDRLRCALRDRTGRETALVPLIERHAGALVAAGDDAMRHDPDVAARAFRTIAGLYPLDGLTIGAGAAWVAAAAREVAGDSGAADPSMLPVPADVASARAVAHVRDVAERVRPVVRDRCGVVIVLPDVDRLLGDLGLREGVDWAVSVLLAIVRAVGQDEPDALFLRPPASATAVGNRDGTDTLESVASHFDVPLVSMTAGTGVEVIEAASLTRAEPRREGFELRPETRLVTTDEEIAEAADPATVGRALAALRRSIDEAS
jgi:hypothetical protein